MELKQNSNQCAILLHEIYGINSHINYYAKALYEKEFDVYAPNLLQRTTAFAYEEEELAYKNFMENVSFEKAKNEVNILIEDLSRKYAHIRLIGQLAIHRAYHEGALFFIMRAYSAFP